MSRFTVADEDNGTEEPLEPSQDAASDNAEQQPEA